MLLNHEIERLMKDLCHVDSASIDLGGSNIKMKTLDDGSKIVFSTLVYFGGNYIPKSVRKCTQHRAPFESIEFPTSLKIDEENFKIYLNYIDEIVSVNPKRFVHMLEDFSGLAAKWKEYLDEHDQNDLVYVPVK